MEKPPPDQAAELRGLLDRLERQLGDTPLSDLMRATSEFGVSESVVEAFAAAQRPSDRVVGGLVAASAVHETSSAGVSCPAHDGSSGGAAAPTDASAGDDAAALSELDDLRTSMDRADEALSLLDSRADQLLSRLDTMLQSLGERS